jgi:hypothetical protein
MQFRRNASSFVGSHSLARPATDVIVKSTLKRIARFCAFVALLGAAGTALATPRFTTNPPTTANEDSAYQYNVDTTDNDSGDLQVSAVTIPAWLALSNVNVNNGTARLAGTPAQANVGAHAVSLRVRNLRTNLTALQNFTIVVANVNDAPAITGQTPNPIPLLQGSSLTIVFTHLVVTDVDDTYPQGFTLTVLNGSNYTRNGNTITPTASFTGTLTVPVRVNDGAANSNTFNLSVNVTSSNQPPVIVAPIPNQVGVENAPFQLRDASGAAVTLGAFFRDPNPGDTLTYQVTGLPPSGNLVANATTGQITGTPRATDVRATPYAVTVTASDGKTAAGSLPRQTFNLTISASNRADLSLAITATPAPAVVDAPIEWRFGVGNAGPQQSGGISLTAEFAGNPFGFTSLGSCSLTPVADRQRLTCSVAPIAAGTTSSVVLRGATAQDGDVYVTGSVTATSGPSDSNAANNAVATALHIARVLSGNPAQRLSSPGSSGAAAGDLNGDGFADVVLASATGGAELYLNVVDGVNAARRKLADIPLTIGEPTPAANVLLVDLDRDNDLDLVAANDAGGSNAAYANTGVGAFTRIATLGGGASRAAASADFDGDGRADLAFANGGPNTVYLNRGGGVFALVAQLDNDDSHDVLAGDLDLDGRPDLVFANANGPSRYYRNSGAGNFATGVVVDTAGARAVAAADFNRDGRTDLVFGVRDSGSGPPSNPVYQNNPGTGGSPLFVLLTRLGASPTTRVLTADFDADGSADVVTLNTTGTHQLYRGSGAGTFSLHSVQFSWDTVAGAAAAAISVDAGIDIVTGGGTGGAVFFNDGRGGFGLGDTTAPVIQLLGPSPAALTVGNSYQDAGATANDDIDGNITTRIVTNNPVNTAIVGTYTVTYDVRDSSGNATRVTRRVEVEAREGTGGGGGGAIALLEALLLALLAAWRCGYAGDTRRASARSRCA